MNNNLNILSIPCYCAWYRLDKRLKYFFKKIKWSFQRITRGYSDYDIYNLYYWLIRVIPSAIRDLEKDLHGFPFDMTEEAWKNYLLDMASHFENYYAEWENPVELPSVSIKSLFEKNGDVVRRVPTDEIKDSDFQEKRKLWREEEEKHDQYMREELHKGLSMLEARFGDLWD